MALPYFENTTLTGFTQLINELQTQLLAQSWTNRTINADNTLPASSHQTREEHFIAPGIADEASGVKVGFSLRRNSGDTVTGVKITSWVGEKTATILTAVQTASATVTVTTTAAHGFATGDFIKGINGTDNVANNVGGAGNDTVATLITVTDTDEFTYVTGVNQTSTGNGGTVVVAYNHVGGSSFGNSEGYQLNSPDASMDLFAYVDEFRICGVLQQGGNQKPFYCGQPGRSNVQDDGRSVAISNTAITGSGSQTITLAVTPANMYVGQPVWAVAIDEADVEVTVIDDLVGDQLTAVFNTAFTSGAVIGWDPTVSCAGAPLGTAVSVSLGSLAANMGFGIDGTRRSAGGQQDQEDTSLIFDWVVNESSTGDVENATDPDDSGVYQGRDGIHFQNAHGVRQFTPGFSFMPLGVQNDFDIHRIGATPITQDFKVLVSNTLDGWALVIGPGATNT